MAGSTGRYPIEGAAMERGDVSAVVVACGVVVAAVAIVVSVIVPLILGLFERRP